MKDCVVRFENVYKVYPFYQSITQGFKSFLFNLPRSLKTLKKSSFIALNDVSFEVKKGETFGIIGRNGSGKSTILSIIAGVIRQDRGHVYRKGRTSSLLELGAGFHPDLSGVENIILNGILMGNTKREMMEKMEGIVDFSELGDFIYQPLRTYSSGMYVRLGFSVAIHIDPDILLIDEALAVGDIRFQEKCLERLSEFKKAGVTIIIVSHDLSSIKGLCDRVMWIEKGQIKMVGMPEEVVYAYLECVEGLSFLPSPLPTASSKNVIDEVEKAPTKIETWWDSGIVIDSTEKAIIGEEFKDFYDYIKICFGLQGLKGIGVLNKLKHSRGEFVRSGICHSFKVVKEKDLLRESSESYDLFISFDFLGRVIDREDIIKKIRDILRDNGILIALDLVDSTPYSEKERNIAVKVLENLGFNKEFLEKEGSLETKDNLLEVIRRYFKIMDIRFFGGPFYDLILNKIANMEIAGREALIKTIITIEQIMLKEGVLKGRYGLIVAKKGSHNEMSKAGNYLSSLLPYDIITS